MKTTNKNTETISMVTKADQLIEVAKWVKRQNPDFTKNFKSMRSIIRFYLQLPECYDKSKSLVAFINKHLESDCRKWDSYTANEAAKRLSVLANTLFEFRYFEKAPFKWKLDFGLRRYTYKSGEQYEVYCSPFDRCNIYDDFKPQRQSTCSITIKSLGDAKRAADQLLASELKRKGNDYEVTYDNRLTEAMKQSEPTDEELREGIEVVI